MKMVQQSKCMKWNKWILGLCIILVSNSNAQVLNYQSYNNLMGVLQSLNVIYSIAKYNYIDSLNILNTSVNNHNN
jgi:hypothetical protein